ncbi:hypothetical protein ACPUYX_02865 [Desulfosporosinus sp. SYSU MS00001]|uniref:hypothetical protein n=1 Tax=Desulfosporosinus sp. SYSU MS00001 TaxID=3416284 RepID=UPI003CF5F071
MIFCLGQIKKELTKQSLSGVGLGIEMETELWVTAQKCAPSAVGGSGDALLLGSNKEGINESVLVRNRFRKRKRETEFGVTAHKCAPSVLERTRGQCEDKVRREIALQAEYNGVF